MICAHFFASCTRFRSSGVLTLMECSAVSTCWMVGTVSKSALCVMRTTASRRFLSSADSCTLCASAFGADRVARYSRTVISAAKSRMQRHLKPLICQQRSNTVRLKSRESIEKRKQKQARRELQQDLPLHGYRKSCIYQSVRYEITKMGRRFLTKVVRQ